jgi:hypothetical protein
MPIIMQNYMQSNPNYLNNESMLSITEIPAPNISAQELLFPAFNSLVPLLFESVVPFLAKSKNISDVNIMINCIHQSISFAFKTQVFNKIIWKQVSALLSKTDQNQDLNNESQIALMV